MKQPQGVGLAATSRPRTIVEWEVQVVNVGNLRHSLFEEGWEPFAVTLTVHNEYVYHLRHKKVTNG